jgi:RNA polymerase subunit RPABC4/transcription elongation factor Spt4
LVVFRNIKVNADALFGLPAVIDIFCETTKIIVKGLYEPYYELKEIYMSDIQPPAKGPDEIYCSSCGAVIKKEAEICPKCGVRQKPSGYDISKNWLTTLLIAIFLGEFGGHRFYVGKIGTGILMLLTGGGCGIWWIIDIVIILTDKFTDAKGNVITRN